MPNDFPCPACQSANGISIGESIDIGGDNDFDEVIVQSMWCESCKRAGLGLYKESRRGRLDDESWHHEAYWLDEESNRNLETYIAEAKEKTKNGAARSELCKLFDEYIADGRIVKTHANFFWIE